MSKRKFFDDMLKDVKKDTKTKNLDDQELQKDENTGIQVDVNKEIQENRKQEDRKPVITDSQENVKEEIHNSKNTGIQVNVNKEKKKTGNKEIKKPVKQEKRKTANTSKSKTRNTGNRKTKIDSSETIREVKKKTFELPLHITKRLETYAAITDEFEVEIVSQAVTEYLDRLGVPKDFEFKFTKK